MTVLHLTTFLQGGAGRVIAALAVGQRRDGHRVVVVTSRTGPAGYGNYEIYIDELTSAGVAVHLVDSMFLRDHAANLAVVRALDRLFAFGEEPDVIHAHAAIPSLVALLFAGSRSRPIPILQTMHGWGVRKTPEQVTTDSILINLVQRVVVPSQHARAQLSSFGVSPARIVVVPYGVEESTSPQVGAGDRELMREMATARRRGALVIACIGTIGARKNQQLIVDALRILMGTLDVFCVFVGDGDCAELATATALAGLADRCRIHGYSAAARRIAAAADVFVLPSRSEGQPIGILEAFADGVTVAASDVPELVELVDDGVTGVIFRVDEPASLARALERLAAMSSRDRDAMRSRARHVYESTFTNIAMVERYNRAYSEVATELRPK